MGVGGSREADEDGVDDETVHHRAAPSSGALLYTGPHTTPFAW
jgi:hypothetical protein